MSKPVEDSVIRIINSRHIFDVSMYKYWISHQGKAKGKYFDAAEGTMT